MQNADWRCAALPGSLPRPKSVCLDFVLCSCRSWILVRLWNGFRHRMHTLCSSCLHRMRLRSLSPYSTSLFLSPDHLSITPSRLLICPSSVSRYRTRSTYSGYTFIHLPQTRCSLDPWHAALIVNDLFRVTSSMSPAQSTPSSVPLHFCTHPPLFPHPLFHMPSPPPLP